MMANQHNKAQNLKLTLYILFFSNITLKSMPNPNDIKETPNNIEQSQKNLIPPEHDIFLCKIFQTPNILHRDYKNNENIHVIYSANSKEISRENKNSSNN